MDTPRYGATLDERLDSDLAQWTQALRAFSRRLHVAMPAIVRAFDHDKQTVSVEIAILDVERVDGVVSSVSLPILQDVPIMLPRFGSWSLTGPIQAGDECLVIFGDVCIDGWWESGKVLQPQKQRRHTIADGFALFGPWSQKRKLSSYSTSSAQLRNEDGTVVIDLADDTISIQAPTVNVTATSQVNISGSGHVSIEGKDWLSHKHTGVSAGSGVSGPVL